MAAMDVARSRSQLPSSPPSATSASFLAATPEPHYRLSRLNSPPPAAALRPPSIIARSVSAGMTFSFKKEPREKEKQREKDLHLHPRAPSPDDRPQSRFGFTLRKKVSLASLLNSSSSSAHADEPTSSRTSSSSGGGHPAAAAPPIEEAPKAPAPAPVPREEEASDGDEDVHAPVRFVKKSVWRTRNKMKLHPYPDAPYMQAYDPIVLENERATHHLLRRLSPVGSPTFHNYAGRPPPSRALDLGCGAGFWLLDAARTWRTSQIVGLDLVNVALPPLTDGSLPNVRLVRGDFLKYALPFGDGAFELVRMANLGLCVPTVAWDGLFREVWRVLAPGGRLELVDDQVFFPYGGVPVEEIESEPEMEVEAGPEESAAPPATTPLLSPSTPRPPPPTPDVSAFFDSSDEESDGEEMATPPQVNSDDDELFLAPTPDSASERSSRSSSDSTSFNDTASTLIGSASERGSLELLKSEFTKHSSAPQLDVDFERAIAHRPFSGVEHLVIAIPSPSEPLPTIDVTLDADLEGPLTPVPPPAPPVETVSTPLATQPPSSSGLPFPTTSATPTPSVAADELAPPTPTESEHEFALGTGPWSTQAAAARDLERVYTRMLTSRYGLHVRPAALAIPLLARVFCAGRTGRVERPTSFHLKLAPVELAEEVGRWEEWEREKEEQERREREKELKEREKEKGSLRGKGGKKEWVNETPIPQGLSAKAAERLGIVGAGVPQVRRQPTFLESPVESDEDDENDESEGSGSEQPERGASTWVPPSEWDAPPLSAGWQESLEGSSSSKTITAAASARTITAASSTKTLTVASTSTTVIPPPRTESPLPLPQPRTPTMTHTRGGSTTSNMSAASSASSVSSASSGACSVTGPQGVANRRAQHPGLLLWPGTFIPLPPAELELHATKHMQTLLGCKPALAEFVGTFVDNASGTRVVSEDAFEDAVWEYECFRRPRFNWPDLQLDSEEEMPDMPTPASARSAHHVIPRTPTFPDAKDTMVVGPYRSGDLTHVRTFRVFGAVKGVAAPAL